MTVVVVVVKRVKVVMEMVMEMAMTGVMMVVMVKPKADLIKRTS